MRKKITQVSFTRIPKLEFRTVVNGVVGIVSKYNPTELHIDDTLDLVSAATPLLRNLRNSYKRHPKTASLIVLRKQRKDLIVAITTQVRAATKANLDTQYGEIELVTPFVEEYLGGILEENSTKQSERIHLMLTDLSSNQTVAEAFASLGVSLYSAQLHNVQQQIDETLDTRVKSKSIRPRAKTGAVKTALAETLNDLLNDIELAQKKYPALDYAPLINELNEFLIPVQAKIKAADTRHKHAKATSTNDNTTLQTIEKVA